MEDFERINLINKIIPGLIYRIVDSTLYKTNFSTKEDYALANLLYEDIIYDTKYSESLTRKRVKRILHSKGIWTVVDDNNLKNLEKVLDDLKVELYNSFLKDKKAKDAIRRRIKSTKKAIENSFSRKMCMDYMTIESYAENLRNKFLLALSITDNSGTRIYDYESFYSGNPKILNSFLSYKLHNQISSVQHRELARTEPFKTLWSLGKDKIFGEDYINLTSDQRSLILFAQMYENIEGHPERPNKDIIEDDDMLDGWLVLQKRKREKDILDKETENLLESRGVKHGHRDVFIMAESPEEARRIKGLNSPRSLSIMQANLKKAGEGRVEEINMPGVKTDLIMKARQQGRGK